MQISFLFKDQIVILTQRTYSFRCSGQFWRWNPDGDGGERHGRDLGHVPPGLCLHPHSPRGPGKPNVPLRGPLLVHVHPKKAFVKFRTANHQIPGETGRWHGKSEKSERLCTICNSGQIGDEFHFILECKSLKNLRKNYLCKYYYQNPNIIKFNELMSTVGKTLLYMMQSVLLSLIPYLLCCHY